MHIDLEEENKEPKYINFKENDTIIIDNGTDECKAGYLGGEPQMVFKNIIYRQKNQISIENFRGATAKTMFDSDVITNFEVLEYVMDEILTYLHPTKLVNLIFTEKIYSPTHQALVEFLFTVYGFKKIQIGVDSYYSYLQNLNGEDCLIIDMSHSAVTSLVIKNKKIIETYKINFGGKAAGEYLSALMSYKFFDSKKNYKKLIEYLRCSEDYNTEAEKIYKQIKKGDYTNNAFIDEDIVENEANPIIFVETEKKDKKSSQLQINIPEFDTNLLNTPDTELNTESIKEKRRQKILYHSTVYRLKNKIEKSLLKIEENIKNTEEEYEKFKDLDGYINKKKKRLEELNRELELRSKLRKDVKNRKTYEFQIKFKEGELTESEEKLIEKIKDAEDMDKEDLLLEKAAKLIAKITALDPYFEPYKADTYELLTGEAIGRKNVNIDLIKIPEILFNPTIVGSEQMGLLDILEDVSKKYQLSKVFLTGGFSQIKGIEKRIKNEMIAFSFVGEIEVIKAEDPVYDSFKGATFSDEFPIYTLEDFKKQNFK